ncbi:hypothetical protein POM88_036020 [Heracleum sosnowskyi]|uniref:Uncharacterized protein n=1 Tax=Heracleum sosnowskyi TaxID=360622 RepID=A0AAD8HPA3_9APIA|nr:hypothetical protein POM88_036020 [Heracleum sosnowskyi]
MKFGTGDFHVHAFAIPEIWNGITNIIAEGNLYEFFNFIIIEAIGPLRPVSSNYMIRLNQLTTVHHLFGYPVFIPRNKFELSDIAQINDVATVSDTNGNASYAIGEFYLRSIWYNCFVFIRFTLYDGSYIKVIVWNQLLEALDPILEDNIEHPRIVILAGFRPYVNRGIAQLSSLPCSRIFINYRQHGATYLMRQKHSIKVVLSDDEILMLDLIRNGNFDNPPIIIFTSYRAHTFKGNVILKCIQSSRIYIDPPYQAAIVMRQRLIEEGLYEGQKDSP